MSIAIWYWIFYVLAILLAGWVNYPFAKPGVPWLIVFILLGFLGWATFGSPIRG